jgi:hypothetical protein
MMTAGRRATNSVASAGTRSGESGDRCSNTTLRPSIHPSSERLAERRDAHLHRARTSSVFSHAVVGTLRA